MVMAARRKIFIFLIIACLVAISLILLSSIKKEPKGIAADQFLFAIINEAGPKKDHFQILAYTAIDSRKKEMLAIIVPEDTKLEMPGTGFNRLRHAYYFKDFSLTSKSIAKFISIKTSAKINQGYYIAVDAKYLAGLIDDMGGVYKRQEGKTIDGKTAMQELKQAARQRDPEAYGAVIYTLFEKPGKFAGKLGRVITFKDSTTQDSSQTARSSASVNRGRWIYRASFGLISQEAAAKTINRVAKSLSRTNRAVKKSINRIADSLSFKDSTKHKNHGTNLKERDFKKTMVSIRSLKKATVVVLPGIEREYNGVFYWAPEKAILTNLREVIAGDGLIAGIRYTAKQRHATDGNIFKTEEDAGTALRP